jgi:uncharacterized membrane protein YccC
MSSAGPIQSNAARSENVFHLRQAFKLALSMVLFYWLALWMNWDVPQYGGLAIVIISLGTTGATIEKGMARFVGTTVGVLVGFLVLGLFNYDRWAVMLAFAFYLALIGYFMQASRYSYAWYVAAFVPLVVWGDNYPHFDSAFYFGVFRYLETTAGILIYTAVDLVLWPRQAGDRLGEQGDQFWSAVRKSFRSCRHQLADAQSDADVDRVKNLTGSLKQLTSTLQDACLDTPVVRSQRRVWEVWRLHASDLVDALVSWHECANSAAGSDLGRLLPHLGAQMNILEKRFERIAALWQQRQHAADALDHDDSPLLKALTFDGDESVASESDLTHFVHQLEAVDEASRGLLRTSRVLARLDRSSAPSVSPSHKHVSRLFGWERERLIQSLFPPVAFIAAFLFWIFVNPPTGPKVPMFAGILALVLLRTPMNPLPLLVIFVLSIFVAVAPVYWLVMPSLSTGFELLSLIFVYSFIFGYLGGRSPALKSGPIIMFVTMTGISNQQAYSFNGTVDGALMILLAGSVMAVVYYFFTPQRPK